MDLDHRLGRGHAGDTRRETLLVWALLLGVVVVPGAAWGWAEAARLKIESPGRRLLVLLAGIAGLVGALAACAIPFASLFLLVDGRVLEGLGLLVAEAALLLPILLIRTRPAPPDDENEDSA